MPGTQQATHGIWLSMHANWKLKGEYLLLCSNELKELLVSNSEIWTKVLLRIVGFSDGMAQLGARTLTLHRNSNIM